MSYISFIRCGWRKWSGVLEECCGRWSGELDGDSSWMKGNKRFEVCWKTWRTLLDGAFLAFVAEEDLEFCFVFVGESGERVWDAGCLGERVHCVVLNLEADLWLNWNWFVGVDWRRRRSLENWSHNMWLVSAVRICGETARLHSSRNDDLINHYSRCALYSIILWSSGRWNDPQYIILRPQIRQLPRTWPGIELQAPMADTNCGSTSSY